MKAHTRAIHHRAGSRRCPRHRSSATNREHTFSRRAIQDIHGRSKKALRHPWCCPSCSRCDRSAMTRQEDSFERNTFTRKHTRSGDSQIKPYLETPCSQSIVNALHTGLDIPLVCNCIRSVRRKSLETTSTDRLCVFF